MSFSFSPTKISAFSSSAPSRGISIPSSPSHRGKDFRLVVGSPSRDVTRAICVPRRRVSIPSPPRTPGPGSICNSPIGSPSALSCSPLQYRLHHSDLQHKLQKSDLRRKVFQNSRRMSISEDADDDMMIFPLTDIDNSGGGDNNANTEVDDDDDPFKGFRPMTLRQRRSSKLNGGLFQPLNLNLDEIRNRTEAAIESPPPMVSSSPATPGSLGARLKWKRALTKIKSMEDPWVKFNLESLPTETVVRHRYNALRQKWVTDEVKVKMENTPFNHGAMRSCFRMKKQSSFSQGQGWKKAMNYVAKRYMEAVDREVYFEDVRLQMDAKLWGEEYNRHNPPKKVDIFQMAIVEFKGRKGKPIYHLEHFIEGDYIKYNSNSGFVAPDLRRTPQAFSHFTFERSGHQLIVVDIQGVGDLWTDPQIHTADGEGYGDGNLGPRGMALFFHSHVCNTICESMNLSKFDLSLGELAARENKSPTDNNNKMATSRTVVKGQLERCMSAESSELPFLMNRSRTISSCSTADSQGSDEMEDSSNDPFFRASHSSISEEEMQFGSTTSPSPFQPIPGARVRFGSDSDESASASASASRRRRYIYADSPVDSVCGSLTETRDVGNRFKDMIIQLKGYQTLLHNQNEENNKRMQDEDDDDLLTPEEERQRFIAAASRMHRASCVQDELSNIKHDNMPTLGDSVLGLIHHELAKYHELGRFAKDENEIDHQAALFHEQQAAELGIMEAILTMARLFLGLQREVLVNVSANDDNAEDKGVDYMHLAAEAGDRFAMIYMAKAYQSGQGLGSRREKNYQESLQWFQDAVSKTQEDESGDFDAAMDDPVYQLQASIAELYLEGGYGLQKDPSSAGDMYNEAAECAMAAMKGRLANRFYALAEEAYGQIEE